MTTPQMDEVDRMRAERWRRPKEYALSFLVLLLGSAIAIGLLKLATTVSARTWLILVFAFLAIAMTAGLTAAIHDGLYPPEPEPEPEPELPGNGRGRDAHGRIDLSSPDRDLLSD